MTDNQEQKPGIDKLMGSFFKYPRVKRVLSRLEWTRIHGRNANGSYDGMLITGDTRTGKTRLLEQYRDSFGPYIDRDKRIVRRPQRVLLIETPRHCTPKGLCFAIYDHFGIEPKERSGTVPLTFAVMDFLRSIGTEVLMLDEVHHMFRQDSLEHASEVADFFKTILNHRVCTLVLCGMPELIRICDSNDQINERLLFKMTLNPYLWDVEDEQHEFRLILDSFEEQLPFKPIKLGANRELAYKIWYATQGRIGSAAALIKSAALRVMIDEGDCLTLEAFAEAYAERQAADALKNNPFIATMSDLMAVTPIWQRPPQSEAKSGLRKGKGRTPKMTETLRK